MDFSQNFYMVATYVECSVTSYELSVHQLMCKPTKNYIRKFYINNFNPALLIK
jgi:hypothetical protein